MSSTRSMSKATRACFALLFASEGNARKRGDIPAKSNTRRMASLLVDCWEGAALRSRLRGTAAPLTTMLDFYFQSAAVR